MQFPQTFLPTVHQVGVLALVTEFFLVAAAWGFLAAAVFFLTTRNGVAPRHRPGAVLAAAIALVAGISYWTIRYYFHDQLHQLAVTADAGARAKITRDAFLAINRFRYMDWAVTTPLLLVTMVRMLRVQLREVLPALAVLLLADGWMILAGYVGELQLAADGTPLPGPRLLWGAFSTVGYAAVVAVLFGWVGRRFGGWTEPGGSAGGSDEDTARAFRLMAFSTVTFWGAYPLGYLAVALWPRLDLNWLHLAFTAADLVNKVGVGVVAYVAGARELARRVPPEAVQSARLAA